VKAQLSQITPEVFIELTDVLSAQMFLEFQPEMSDEAALRLRDKLSVLHEIMNKLREELK
jgi:hypothetical protein